MGTKYDFIERGRIFDITKDKLVELPIYDQLDWLIMFLCAPGNTDGVSIRDVAFFIGNMPPNNNAMANTDKSIALSRGLLSQLLEDKYITGSINPLEMNNDKVKMYVPTIKARLALEEIGGYRSNLSLQQLETKNVYNVRKDTIDTNKKLIIIFSFTLLATLFNAFVSYLTYKNQININDGKSQSTIMKAAIEEKERQLQRKDQDLGQRQNVIDSLIVKLISVAKPSNVTGLK